MLDESLSSDAFEERLSRNTTSHVPQINKVNLAEPGRNCFGRTDLDGARWSEGLCLHFTSLWGGCYVFIGFRVKLCGQWGWRSDLHKSFQDSSGTAKVIRNIPVQDRGRISFQRFLNLDFWTRHTIDVFQYLRQTLETARERPLLLESEEPRRRAGLMIGGRGNFPSSSHTL